MREAIFGMFVADAFNQNDRNNEVNVLMTAPMTGWPIYVNSLFGKRSQCGGASRGI